MKKGKTILMQALFSLVPIIYLLSIWNNLPETVPTHYNLHNQADSFGSKFEILGVVLFVFVVTIGMTFLVLNLHKFDPKKRYASNNALLVKISWALTLFISLISCCIVYSTDNYDMTQGNDIPLKYIVALVALLFVALGNFMNTIKPNHFVGIRTPWTLSDEENWRMTHYFGAKVWFFGGLALFTLVMFLPTEYVSYAIVLSIVTLAGIPIWYSFYQFRQKQKLQTVNGNESTISSNKTSMKGDETN